MAAPTVSDGLEMAGMGNKLAQQDSTAEIETGADGELSPRHSGDLPEDLRDGYTANDRRDMQRMGKKQEFRVRIFQRGPRKPVD